MAAGLPPLLPTPKRIGRRPGAFALRDGVPVIVQPGAGEAVQRAARVLCDGLRERCGVALAHEVHTRTSDLGPRIELRREGESGEAHRINVMPERIELVGAGPAGLRYAVETLLQLARGRRIPGCSIEDAPDLGIRGVMLDVSRGKVPTLASLRQLVDVCVRLKLNALMLYVEHTFRFRRHPRIGEGASPLDAATLLELDAYAAASGVELIPSLQSLGHMEHVLALPEYAGLAETERRWTISPAEPGTYELLEQLYDEYLPLFRSPLFNANCDEPYDLGSGKSAARGRALGPGGVFLGHVRRVRDLARQHGKRTLIWSDVVHAHPERIPEIDRDLVMLDWWYEAQHDYSRVARFAENGLDFLVCPGTSTWNCLFPRLANSLENITRYAEAGKRHGALGLIVTDWGDFGHYNLQGYSWFGYAWAAQQAWSGDVPPRDFDRAFGERLFGDPSGATAKLYRELGGIHEAGFEVFNASPLQCLYFDDVERGFFVEGTRPAAVRRSLRRVQRVRRHIEEARERFRRETLTWEELRLAADASAHALRKALAGRSYLAWRRGGGRGRSALDARARRRLALEMNALADEQLALARELRRLWLRRSAPSNFEITRRRIDRSLRSLRGAARALGHRHPPPPPPPHPGFDVGTILNAARGE